MNCSLTSLLPREQRPTRRKAARAFDRAAINKAGPAAALYPITDYAKEMGASEGFRQRAGGHPAGESQETRYPTSLYRGVSLLKQTGKWHGQINVGGNQLHLGFFATEELAARAYDRAAIHKASTEDGVLVTNLDISGTRLKNFSA